MKGTRVSQALQDRALDAAHNTRGTPCPVSGPASCLVTTCFSTFNSAVPDTGTSLAPAQAPPVVEAHSGVTATPPAMASMTLRAAGSGGPSLHPSVGTHDCLQHQMSLLLTVIYYLSPPIAVVPSGGIGRLLKTANRSKRVELFETNTPGGVVTTF